MPFRFACRSLSALALIIAGVIVFAGCAGRSLNRPLGGLAARSADGSRTLRPIISTAVYMPDDVAAAEIYLTDLPVARLSEPSDNLAGLSGSLVQVRMFLVPRAGSTPIQNTACNITMRHIVLSAAGAEELPLIGVYGGGGFLLPEGKPGDKSISGSLSEVTLRLLSASGGFADLLGPAAASGRFSAKQDAKLARVLAARAQRLMDSVGR